MYDFAYQKPGALADAVKALGDSEAEGAGRRPDLHSGAQAAAKPTLDHHRSGEARPRWHQQQRQHGHDRSDDHPRGSGGFRPDPGEDPRPRRARRMDRRSRGASPRHHRRLAREQRSVRLLPVGGAGARRDDQDRQSLDQGRRLFPGHVHDRAEPRRDHHLGGVPGAGEIGLREVPQPGLALRHRRRVCRQGAGGYPRSGHRRRPERRIPAEGDGGGVGEELVARRGGRHRDGARGAERRHPRQFRVSRPPDRRDGEAGCSETL